MHFDTIYTFCWNTLLKLSLFTFNENRRLILEHRIIVLSKVFNRLLRWLLQMLLSRYHSGVYLRFTINGSKNQRFEFKKLQASRDLIGTLTITLETWIPRHYSVFRVFLYPDLECYSIEKKTLNLIESTLFWMLWHNSFYQYQRKRSGMIPEILTKHLKPLTLNYLLCVFESFKGHFHKIVLHVHDFVLISGWKHFIVYPSNVL